MSSFAPRPVLMPHHFEIAPDGRGCWVARDKEGLIGGLFRTQRDALRFALFEVAGDRTCVRVSPAENTLTQEIGPPTTRNGAIQSTSRRRKRAGK
jgi:hypothetical protein